jgi:hypothetical protein
MQNQIRVVKTTSPLIVSDGNNIPTRFIVNTIADFLSDVVGNVTIMGDAVGGGVKLQGRSSEGALASPTPTTSGRVMLDVGAVGCTTAGTLGITSVADITFAASENFSASANGTQINFSTTLNGGTVKSIGAVLQNTGDLTVGTTLDVSGGGKLQVVGGALVDVVRVGTTAAAPTITSGAGAPATVTPNGSLFIRTDGTLGARLYVSNGATWAATANV